MPLCGRLVTYYSYKAFRIDVLKASLAIPKADNDALRDKW